MGSGDSSPPADAADAASQGGDASQADAAAACVTSGTELCDGFESGQLDTGIWKTVLMGPSAAATVDSAHAHTGKYAAHLQVTPGNQSTAQITETKSFPATNNAFYTRIWAYFSPAVMWQPANADYHTGFIIASGKNNLGPVDLAIGANLSPNGSAGPMHYLGYSIFFGPPKSESGPRSNTPVTTLAWTCIELFESGQGMASTRRVWVDGQELMDQRVTNMDQQAPTFDTVAIGIWEYHPTPSLSDMWVDDVRVSSQQIGCGN